MLSYEELLSQIKQLPGSNRLALLEEIAHSLRKDFTSIKTEDQVKNDAGLKSSTLEHLYGILKTEGIPQTDEEIRDDYNDYLAKKYARQKR